MVIFVWGIKNGCVLRIKEKSLDLTIKVKDKFVCFFFVGPTDENMRIITEVMRKIFQIHEGFQLRTYKFL
jgi:hypothetical protein